MKVETTLENLKKRFPNEPEYFQAVEEVLHSIEDEYNKHPEFEACNLIERLCIPDRIFTFRVTWMDDNGKIQINTGYRVQHNNAIGPYKGGIRFHPSVEGRQQSVTRRIKELQRALLTIERPPIRLMKELMFARHLQPPGFEAIPAGTILKKRGNPNYDDD